MKKLLLISMLIGAMPLSMLAQVDDLYFVPKKKKAQVERVKDNALVVAPQPKAKSSYEVIDGDTTNLDVIDFTEGKGIYPEDSLDTEDYALTKKMVRFEDYDLSDNASFWAGYRAGRSVWMWHSPWYYSRYGWYDPWYYRPWYYCWYDPWYDPWFYDWYYPWYGSYYGWWGRPYYHHGYYANYYYGGGGYRHYYGRTGNAGSIDVSGRTGYRHDHRNTVTTNASRMTSLRNRAMREGGNRVYTSGNSQRSNSGNFSGRRNGNTNYSSPVRSSNSSYSSGNTRSSSGSFSRGGSRSGGGSFGGSRGGSGGGSRMGGRR